VLFLEGFWLVEDDKQEEIPVVPRTRRFRRTDNLFDVYRDFEFKRRYGLTKEYVIRLENLVRPHLESRGRGQGAPLF